MTAASASFPIGCSSELRLFAAAAAPGLQAVRGRDLIAEPPHRHVTGQPDGTPLDLLSLVDRLALDAKVRTHHDAWAVARRDELAVDGGDVQCVWSDELARESNLSAPGRAAYRCWWGARPIPPRIEHWQSLLWARR